MGYNLPEPPDKPLIGSALWFAARAQHHLDLFNRSRKKPSTIPTTMPAQIIIIEGPPGSGKSTAWRNVPPKFEDNKPRSIIISPTGKALPWPGGMKDYGKQYMTVPKLTSIPTILKDISDKSAVQFILLDDFNHWQNERVQSDQFHDQGMDKNMMWTRWSVLAKDTFKALFGVLPTLRNDITVVVHFHTEINDRGKQAIKSAGTMVTREVQPESYATVVLHAMVVEAAKREDRYKFLTNDDGMREAKSPMGMFTEDLVPNDTWAVIQRVNAYYQEQQTTKA